MKMDIADYSVYGNSIDVLSDGLILSSMEKLGFLAARIELSKDMPRRDWPPFVWLRYDLRCREDLDLMCGLAGSMEKEGLHVFPSPSSILLAEDKWETFTALRLAGVAAVDSFRPGDVNRHDLPFVVKPRTGWGGMGIRLIENSRDIDDILAEDMGPYIAQPYIAHERVFTVAVAGGSVIAALRTDSRGDDFISNCSEGAPPVLVECPQGMASLAARALEALGLAAGTVDIIESGGSYMVLEVNSAPRLYYETPAGLDLAGPMAKSVTAWWKGNI